MKHFALIVMAASIIAGGCVQNGNSMSKDFLQLATDRYSVRSFSPEPVDNESIDLILRAGQVAPTAVNSQPQKIYIARSAQAIEKLNALSPCIYGAPHCFIFCYDEDAVGPRGQSDNYGEIDVTIVLTHMMLEAANLGIGTCAVGYFDAVKLKEELGLPTNEHPVLIMPFGYPSADSKPSERHSSCRPLEETVSYL